MFRVIGPMSVCEPNGGMQRMLNRSVCWSAHRPCFFLLKVRLADCVVGDQLAVVATPQRDVGVAETGPLAGGCRDADQA